MFRFLIFELQLKTAGSSENYRLKEPTLLLASTEDQVDLASQAITDLLPQLLRHHCLLNYAGCDGGDENEQIGKKCQTRSLRVGLLIVTPNFLRIFQPLDLTVRLSNRIHHFINLLTTQ